MQSFIKMQKLKLQADDTPAQKVATPYMGSCAET